MARLPQSPFIDSRRGMERTMHTIQQIRLAFARAMSLPSIRAALEAHGNAIFVDDHWPTKDHIENRFVLTRVDTPGGPEVLCNGVRCYASEALAAA